MKKYYLLLLIFIFIGIFFRLYNYQYNLHFSGEFGDNLLDIKNLFLGKSIPLLGPPTSHPWLYFGPFYYWLMLLLLPIFKFDPIAAGLVGNIIGVIIIFENYVCVKKIFGKKVGLVSSVIISLSPLWIKFSIASRFYFYLIIFFYPFMYSLWKYSKGNNNYLISSCFFLSLMLNFHYSSLILIPSIVYFIYKNKIYRNRKILTYSLIAFIVGNLPFLIHNFKTNFEMILKFTMWVPYRIAGFLSLYPKNNFDPQQFLVSVNSIYEFIGSSLFFDKYFWLISLLILFYSIFKLSINKNFIYNLTLTSFLTAFFTLIIHQDAPVHYLLPLFPLIPIIIAKQVVKNNYLLLIFILMLISFNMKSYIKLTEKKEFSVNPNFVPLQLQKNIAVSIVKDAEGKKFMLKRVGPYDYFEDNYAQNYIYLLWLAGNEPVNNSNLLYIINEDKNRSDIKQDNLIFDDEIQVYKLNYEN